MVLGRNTKRLKKKLKETAIKLRLIRLDETINRATEDLYTLTNVTPYESVQKVIEQKQQLRIELQELNKEV